MSSRADDVAATRCRNRPHVLGAEIDCDLDVLRCSILHDCSFSQDGSASFADVTLSTHGVVFAIFVEAPAAGVAPRTI